MEMHITAPTTEAGTSLGTLKKTLQKATQKIAPLWPLESFVAVNPYLGLSHLPFEVAAQRLSKVGAGRMALPTAFYLQSLEEGFISMADVAAALQASGNAKGRSAAAFLNQLKQESTTAGLPEVNSFTDVATAATGKDWNEWTKDQVSSWASVFFDQGQLAWNSSRPNTSLFKAWREEAAVNRVPAMHGLVDYRHYVKGLPEDPLAAAQEALHTLKLPPVGIGLYLHRLLARVQGWAAYAAYLDWQQNLYQQTEGEALLEFLAVLLCMEAALMYSLAHPELATSWIRVRGNLLHLAVEESTNTAVANAMVLQGAYDRAAQRHWVSQFAAPQPQTSTAPPKAQAVFCIDVRSEVYRRHLEQASPAMETMGFAGFFAFPISYQPLAHDHSRAQCPVLLPAGPKVAERLAEPALHERAVQRRHVRHQVAKAWKAMKKGAVSCFGYVSPLGLTYLPKLVTDSLGLTRPVPHPDREGLSHEDCQHKTIDLQPNAGGLSEDQQVELAMGALRAMSLTKDFARLVLIVGHGANTVNNPHATGLDCGACGGNAGEANARVAATVLNTTAVRQRLSEVGILIDDNTWFLACQHDTTTDEVSIFEGHTVPTSHKEDLEEVRTWLSTASQTARAERAPRLGIDKAKGADAAVLARSKDWAQVRPEWGLAGCHAFVVAPRKRTRGLNLQGQSFLHSYNWQQDEDFKVLELIMTAPMLVTSWINLQYYASTVDNEHYGAGNKTLHNVTAGLGVLEGSGGDLRTGLPMQSVHDGTNFQHKPVRLNVIIEAPTEAMGQILDRHANVRQLVDNEWIFLWAMDDQGRIAHRYTGHGQWQEVV